MQNNNSLYVHLRTCMIYVIAETKQIKKAGPASLEPIPLDQIVATRMAKDFWSRLHLLWNLFSLHHLPLGRQLYMITL